MIKCAIAWMPLYVPPYHMQLAALMTNPRLLILDEATEGLAPLMRDEIWRTIRLVRDSGIAVVVVDKTVSPYCRWPIA
jgi:ABC-type branched-subunit amino acid transport system ATPase component